MSLEIAIKRGSRGAAKYWVILIIAALIVSVLVTARLGPVYGAKWDLEDRLEYSMLHFSKYGEEWMFDGVQDHVEKNKLPINAWEDCEFIGDVGEPGTFTCNYTIKINFYNIHTHVMPITARSKLTKIPFD